MRKKSIPYLMFILSVFISCASRDAENSQKIIVDYGTAPIIDGIFDQAEWSDACRIRLSSAKSIYLKHDKTNLYIALNGDGGNLYFVKDGKMHILHASFSLGWAEYDKSDSLWTCEKEYEWELYKLQEKSAEEIQNGINDYLKENGWVASLIPMGNNIQSEFAVSFQWLDIEPDGMEPKLIKLPKLFVSSFQNLHPDKRKRRNLTFEDLKLRWPVANSPIDSLDRGYTPRTIDLDVTNWGDVFVRL